MLAMLAAVHEPVVAARNRTLLPCALRFATMHSTAPFCFFRSALPAHARTHARHACRSA